MPSCNHLNAVRMRLVLFFLMLLPALLLGACRQAGDGARQPALPEAQAPEQVAAYKAAAIAEIGVAPGWGRPELVTSVNTVGWEDSAYISPDGQSLYFQYFPGDMFRIEDVFRFHRPVAQGGLGADARQLHRYHRGPMRGVSPAYTSDTLVARAEGAGFAAPQRFAHSRDGRNEWGVMIDGEGAYWYVSHDPSRELNMDLYRNDQLLPIPGRDKFHEDNPHFVVSNHGRELFFDSGNRPQAKGKSHIWVTRESAGRFEEPVMLPPPINLPGSTEVQPHVGPDGRLYFTSARDGTIAIYAAARTGASNWAEPQKLLWTTRKSGSRAWGVGEPTLTADGQWLYFVVVFEDGRQSFDADIARVRRKAGAP